MAGATVAPAGQAAQSMLAFAHMSEAGEDLKPRKARGFGVPPAQRAQARLEMEAMTKTGDWAAATGRHLVALWGLMHQRVYGVAAAELEDSVQYGLAAKAANALIKGHFGEDVSAAIEFMRWAWRREQSREKWRRENGKSGGRMGWRLQFAGSLVTDYRVDMRRR